MNRIELHEKGWHDDLVAVDADPPVPQRDQVLVQVEASGICHRDLIDRGGRIPFLRLPVVPGHEGVGHVVALGPTARTFAIGDRVATLHRDACGRCDACQRGETSNCLRAAHVFGLTADGTYSGWVVAPESAFYRADPAMDAGLAAVLHCTFGTAWRGLVTAGELTRGESVLITGANGGVGEAAVQIAARRASEVVAVVRDPRHTERLRSLGATQVLVSSDNRFHKQAPKVDLALDCVGAPTFNAALRSLRVGGRVSVVGNVTDERAQLNLGLVVVMALRVLGPGGATARDMAEVLAEHAREPFVDIVEERLPLSEADAAQRRLLAGGRRGRAVLLP